MSIKAHHRSLPGPPFSDRFPPTQNNAANTAKKQSPPTVDPPPLATPSFVRSMVSPYSNKGAAKTAKKNRLRRSQKGTHTAQHSTAQHSTAQHNTTHPPPGVTRSRCEDAGGRATSARDPDNEPLRREQVVFYNFSPQTCAHTDTHTHTHTHKARSALLHQRSHIFPTPPPPTKARARFFFKREGGGPHWVCV